MLESLKTHRLSGLWTKADICRTAGIHTDALDYQIRKGTFIKPDILKGNRRYYNDDQAQEIISAIKAYRQTVGQGE